MPTIIVDVLKINGDQGQEVFRAHFCKESSVLEYALDWKSFRLTEDISASIRGQFDASNGGFTLVLTVDGEQCFDAGGYILDNKPCAFGVRVKSMYVGLVFKPDDN